MKFGFRREPVWRAELSFYNQDRYLWRNAGVFNSSNLALYTFVANNPLRYIDPDGKQATDDATPTTTDTSPAATKPQPEQKSLWNKIKEFFGFSTDVAKDTGPGQLQSVAVQEIQNQGKVTLGKGAVGEALKAMASEAGPGALDLAGVAPDALQRSAEAVSVLKPVSEQTGNEENQLNAIGVMNSPEEQKDVNKWNIIGGFTHQATPTPTTTATE